MASLSQLFVLSPRGDAIVTRDYRHNVSRASHEVFFRNIRSGGSDTPPVFHVDGVNYYHIKARRRRRSPPPAFRSSRPAGSWPRAHARA